MPFHQLYLHLILVTKRRAPFIGTRIEAALWAAMAARCRALGCEALAVGGMPDHVHLLIRLPTTLTIAALAKDVKGASSFLMTHELVRGAAFRWQEGYGAFTLRKSEVETVTRYIARQKEHHAFGKLSGLLERAD